MIVYIIGLILSLFFAGISMNKSFDKEGQKLKRNFFRIMSAIPLLFISIIRYGIGVDYFSYANYFLNSIYINYMEVGFDYLTIFIRQLTDNYVYFFAVLSIIFFYFTYKSIYEQSFNPMFSIYLFVMSGMYFNSFGARQMISVAIFLYSLKYVKNRKFVPYILYNLLGMSIHYSSIVFFPVYFLYNIKITPKLHLIIISSIIVLKKLLAQIIYKIILLTKYSGYFESEFNDGHFGFFVLIVPLAVLLFSLLFYNKKSDEVAQKDFNFHCNLLLIQVILSLLQDVAPLLQRVGWGFIFSEIFLLPMVFKKINNKRDKFFYGVGIVFMFALYFILTKGDTPFISIFDR